MSSPKESVDLAGESEEELGEAAELSERACDGFFLGLVPLDAGLRPFDGISRACAGLR
jgi:hypothetical protein